MVQEPTFREWQAEQFFNAQAVLFLCMTCNLYLLCKDGYIVISLALFIGDPDRMLV